MELSRQLTRARRISRGYWIETSIGADRPFPRRRTGPALLTCTRSAPSGNANESTAPRQAATGERVGEASIPNTPCTANWICGRLISRPDPRSGLRRPGNCARASRPLSVRDAIDFVGLTDAASLAGLGIPEPKPPEAGLPALAGRLPLVPPMEIRLFWISLWGRRWKSRHWRPTCWRLNPSILTGRLLFAQRRPCYCRHPALSRLCRPFLCHFPY